MKIIQALCLAATAFLSLTASAATYNIPVGSITDHSNASTSGSIAWYFNTYPAQGNVFSLTSDATYWIGNSLYLPAGCTLKDGSSNGSARIQASSACNDKTMLYMFDGSSVYDLELHGNRKARHIIYANGKNNLWIDNCILHKTKNDYTFEMSPTIVLLKNCSDVFILNNLIRRAGCDPKLNASQWQGTADCIDVSGSNSVTIYDNDIAYALTSGIRYSNAQVVGIKRNIIQHSGLNWLYTHGAWGTVSDAITAYHNVPSIGPTTISYNTIKTYKNHGIHVSGHDLKIEWNTITQGDHRAIYLGDKKTPNQECSYNVTVRHNTVAWGAAGSQNEPIYVYYYQPSTTSIYSNYGSPATYLGPACTP